MSMFINMNKIYYLILLFLTSCVPLIVGGAGVGGAVVAQQERSTGNAIDDASITMKIKSAFLQNNEQLFNKVSVSTHEGRVLLSGVIKSLALKDLATKIAWQEEGVQQVMNELQVKAAKDEINFKDPALDSLITSKVQSKLLLAKGIRSVNYSIKTINQIVYITGVAKTQSELDQVVQIISDISKVKKVVTHVRLK
jgi:osmotically-inducible protein OsmY